MISLTSCSEPEQMSVKDAGYYVIGRITAFNDSYFVQDPECAITDAAGMPLKISGVYWSTPI